MPSFIASLFTIVIAIVIVVIIDLRFSITTAITIY